MGAEPPLPEPVFIRLRNVHLCLPRAAWESMGESVVEGMRGKKPEPTVPGTPGERQPLSMLCNQQLSQGSLACPPWDC